LKDTLILHRQKEKTRLNKHTPPIVGGETMSVCPSHTLLDGSAKQE